VDDRPVEVAADPDGTPVDDDPGENADADEPLRVGDEECTQRPPAMGSDVAG
jgi:hypothetical protein